ncbi:MAG: hypothetical protein ABSC73_06555 [Acidimicrobiales bacterium]
MPAATWTNSATLIHRVAAVTSSSPENDIVGAEFVDLPGFRHPRGRSKKARGIPSGRLRPPDEIGDRFADIPVAFLARTPTRVGFADTSHDNARSLGDVDNSTSTCGEGLAGITTSPGSPV